MGFIRACNQLQVQRGSKTLGLRDNMRSIISRQPPTTVASPRISTAPCGTAKCTLYRFACGSDKYLGLSKVRTVFAVEIYGPETWTGAQSPEEVSKVLRRSFVAMGA